MSIRVRIRLLSVVSADLRPLLEAALARHPEVSLVAIDRPSLLDVRIAQVRASALLIPAYLPGTGGFTLARQLRGPLPGTLRVAVFARQPGPDLIAESRRAPAVELVDAGTQLDAFLDSLRPLPSPAMDPEEPEDRHLPAGTGEPRREPRDRHVPEPRDRHQPGHQPGGHQPGGHQPGDRHGPDGPDGDRHESERPEGPDEDTLDEDRHVPEGTGPDPWWLAGDSPAARTLRRDLDLLARIDDPALVVAGPGIPVEEAARYIHGLSSRAAGPFVVLERSPPAGDLLAHDLFGHVRGAFRGADRSVPGRLETAHHGTLLIEGLETLGAASLRRLRRVIESRELFRLGGTEPIRVNVRILATVDRPGLRTLSADGLGRDLVDLLSVARMVFPPLRCRIEDIAGLAAARGSTDLPASVRRALEEHPWAGNYHEFTGVLERLGRSRTAHDRPDTGLRGVLGPVADLFSSPLIPVRRLEEALIRRTLEDLNGNRSRAALVLGVSRKTLYNQLNALGMRDHD